jgi:hypothetical protein
MKQPLLEMRVKINGVRAGLSTSFGGTEGSNPVPSGGESATNRGRRETQFPIKRTD